MAFPNGWGRKCSLVIQASKVDSDLTDFPVLLTEDSLPLEMFDADGSCTALNGGGDIRFSFDTGGDTQLACEVVTFITDSDPTNGKAEIWVKVPTITSGVNTTFYVWYNNVAGETQPVSSGTYGSDNVWNSNFKGVWHLNKSPSGVAPQELDSTANNNDGISGGSMTFSDLIDGKVGKALDFDGSDDKISADGVISDVDLTSTGKISLCGWFNRVASTGTSFQGFCHDGSWDNYLLIGFDNSSVWFQIKGSGGNTSVKDSTDYSGKWVYVCIVRDGSNLEFFVNGSSKGTTTVNTDVVVTDFDIAWLYSNSYAFTGLVDEVHISSIASSVAWISACYNNQSDPSTFVIKGTPKYVSLCYFSGYVFEQDNPVSRKLYLHNRSTGELVNTTISNDNGYYYMETAFSGSYYIVCLDDAAGIEYNDLIMGPLFSSL